MPRNITINGVTRQMTDAEEATLNAEETAWNADETSCGG